jgi:hypothetical protein
VPNRCQIAWASSTNAAATRCGGGGFGGEFAVAAAKILHECKSGDDQSRSAADRSRGPARPGVSLAAATQPRKVS